MICASLALLQIMFAVHRFAQGATALRAEGGGGALRAQIFKKGARLRLWTHLRCEG